MRRTDGLGEFVDVTQVAQDLRAIDSSVGWERTLAIGELIVTTFFGGRVQELKRARRADQSLRRLAEHQLCPIRKSALAEAMNVYAFVCANPEVRSLDNVAPGHVAVALKCSAEVRLSLLHRVQRERLTVRGLAQHVSLLRRPQSATRAAAGTLIALRKIEERLREVSAIAETSSAWAEDEVAKAVGILANLDELVLSASSAVRRVKTAP